MVQYCYLGASWLRLPCISHFKKSWSVESCCLSLSDIEEFFSFIEIKLRIMESWGNVEVGVVIN